MAQKSYSIDQSPLYKLSTRKRLAELLGFDLRNLEALAARPTNYHEFDIQQGDKIRHVEVPKRALERVHRRLFILLERIKKPPYLHSGTKGRSYITNAKVHLGDVPVVKLDIKKFYPSIEFDRIFRFFQDTLQCPPDVSALLTRLCTINGHIPTGSCVSQLLAYFAALPMFEELSATSGPDIRFTCYVDDMTWSGSGAGSALLWQLKQVIHRHGFRYHADYVYGATEVKVVTGVVIQGTSLKVQQSKEHAQWRELHALGQHHGNERLKALERLIGKVSASAQIDSRFTSRLKSLLERKKRLVKELAVAQESSR